MSDRKPDDERTNQVQASVLREEQRPNTMDEKSNNQLAIATVPIEEKEEVPPQIFKLDVDCVQEMFDFLSIKDIHSVAETCTRMQRIAGDYLPALDLDYYGSNLVSHRFERFNEFLQKIRFLSGVNVEVYRFIGMNCKSLKQIKFHDSDLNAIKIEYIKPILSKIETVLFVHTIEGEFYESFLQFCPKLKHLCIHVRSPNAIIGANNEWLLRSYPTLEQLELCTHVGDLEIPELGTFFELNQNLQEFNICGNAFIKNLNVMLNAKINLEVLTVHANKEEIDIIFNSLKQLHDQKFYQRFHLIMALGNSITVDSQQTIDHITSLPGLQKLYLFLNKFSGKLNLHSLINISELGFINCDDHNTFLSILPQTLKSMMNLRRLFLGGFRSEFIEQFIQYSVTLNAIKIKFLKEDRFIDLFALNKKREQLVGAKKVIIYMEESDYMATLLRTKTTDLKMIELRRAEMYDWELPFIIA